MQKDEIVAVLQGFFWAALIPVFIWAVGWPFGGTFSFHSIVVTFIFLLPFSFFFVFALGLPAFLFLRQFGVGNLWIAAIAGLVLGTLVAFVIHFPFFPNLLDFLYPAFSGMLSALVFWRT